MSNLPLLKGEQCSSVCVWMSKTNRKGTQNSRVVNKEHPNHTANQTVFSHVRALERTVISRAPPSSGQEPRGPAAPNRSRGLTHWVRRRPRRGGGFRGPLHLPSRPPDTRRATTGGAGGARSAGLGRRELRGPASPRLWAALRSACRRGGGHWSQTAVEGTTFDTTDSAAPPAAEAAAR